MKSFRTNDECAFKYKKVSSPGRMLERKENGSIEIIYQFATECREDRTVR